MNGPRFEIPGAVRFLFSVYESPTVQSERVALAPSHL